MVVPEKVVFVRELLLASSSCVGHRERALKQLRVSPVTPYGHQTQQDKKRQLAQHLLNVVTRAAQESVYCVTRCAFEKVS